MDGASFFVGVAAVFAAIAMFLCGVYVGKDMSATHCTNYGAFVFDSKLYDCKVRDSTLGK